MSHLFVFRTYPDIDHMAPLAWRLLEDGEEVHAVVSPGYDPRGDHRIEHLRGYDRFHLHEVWPEGGGRLDAVRGTLRSTLPWALWIVARTRARVVAVEWGYGFAEGYARPRSAAGVGAIARSLARSLRLAPRRDPHQTRVNLLVAARLLGRATACLPHGLSIKLDAATNEQTLQALRNGGLDWRDRNRFTVYVLNTEHHRRFHLEHARGDGDVMQTWGSLRWDPSWFELNRRLVAPYAWRGGDDRVKVVLMVPKWRNRVHAERVVELVRTVQDLPFVSLAIKGHPRPKDGGADPLRAEPSIHWEGIQDVSAIDSVSLIDAADAVLDVGSSIGLEVVLQGRTLINPQYVHDVRTLFDDIPGSCVVARDAADVVAALEDVRAGRPRLADPEAVRELMRRAVYGERDDPYDVVGFYARRFQELATQKG